MTSGQISQGFLLNLYQAKSPKYEEPILQIIGFQINQNDPKQITLSDKQSYIDCSLVGPYVLSGDRIKTSKEARQSESFKKYDIIRITNYFSKIDNKRICKLLMVIRKIRQQKKCDEKIGRPQQISQFVANDKKEINGYGQQKESHSHSHSSNSKNQQLIKIEDDVEQCKNPIHQSSAKFQYSQQSKAQPTHMLSSSKEKNQRNTEQSLTLQQIMANQKGYFIGRLIRAKYYLRQNKQKPLSFFYLGLIDSRGDLVRVNLAGGFAVKYKNELKIGKCYYISELQMFQSDKMTVPLIKVKQKQTKIHEVTSTSIVSKYPLDYYHWEHQFDYIDAQNVDIIGIIDSIEQKTSYKQAGSNDVRQVIRVAIKNQMKTVKISFWADQIKTLQMLNLRINQPVILLDIKKKKKFYLDYTQQTQLIRLNQRLDLKERFHDLLPDEVIALQPKNLKQLHDLYYRNPTDCKLRTIIASITKLNQNRIIYRLCVQCKTKMEKHSQECFNCHSNSYIHKYNCYLDIADATASMSCVAFETIGVIFDKTADQLSNLTDQEIKDAMDTAMFRSYKFTVQNKNQRFVVRGVQNLQDEGIRSKTCQNLKEISMLLQSINNQEP